MRVLVVDDERALAELTARLLSRHHEVRVAGSVQEAMAILPEWKPAAVVSDNSMPGASGSDLLKHLAAEHPEIRRIFYSGGEVDEELAHAVVEKPSPIDALLAALEPQVTQTTVVTRTPPPATSVRRPDAPATNNGPARPDAPTETQLLADAGAELERARQLGDAEGGQEMRWLHVQTARLFLTAARGEFEYAQKLVRRGGISPELEARYPEWRRIWLEKLEADLWQLEQEVAARSPRRECVAHSERD
jgi:CheY-like chemotaxis protein